MHHEVFDLKNDELNIKPIHSHMFITEKFDEKGELTRLKSRLVAGGNEQNPDDYQNLYSPTAAMESISMVIAIAAVENRIIESGDIECAYIEAEIPEDQIVIIESGLKEGMLVVTEGQIHLKDGVTVRKRTSE